MARHSTLHVVTSETTPGNYSYAWLVRPVYDFISRVKVRIATQAAHGLAWSFFHAESLNLDWTFDSSLSIFMGAPIAVPTISKLHQPGAVCSGLHFNVGGNNSGLNVTQSAYYCCPARLSAGGVYHKRSSQGERSANSWLVYVATPPVRPRAGDDETCKAMQPEECSSSSYLSPSLLPLPSGQFRHNCLRVVP